MLNRQGLSAGVKPTSGQRGLTAPRAPVSSVATCTPPAERETHAPCDSPQARRRWTGRRPAGGEQTAGFKSLEETATGSSEKATGVAADPTTARLPRSAGKGSWLVLHSQRSRGQREVYQRARKGVLTLNSKRSQHLNHNCSLGISF